MCVKYILNFNLQVNIIFLKLILEKREDFFKFVWHYDFLYLRDKLLSSNFWHLKKVVNSKHHLVKFLPKNVIASFFI